MNNSENSIPWDDPAWLSEDENCSKRINDKSTALKDPLEGEHGDTMVNSSIDENQVDDETKYVQEFKQFTTNHSPNSNSRHNKSKKKLQKDRIRKHNATSGDLFNQKLTIEVVKDDQRNSKHFQNESRHVYINPDKDDCLKNRDEATRIIDNLIDGNDHDLEYDQAGSGCSKDSFTVTEQFNGQRKPAIKVYDCTAVRGKYSGKLNDPFPDVREERRNPAGFNKNSAFNNNSNRQKQFKQGHGSLFNDRDNRSSDTRKAPDGELSSNRTKIDSTREKGIDDEYCYTYQGSSGRHRYGDSNISNERRDCKSQEFQSKNSRVNRSYDYIDRRPDRSRDLLNDQRLEEEYSSKYRGSKKVNVSIEVKCDNNNRTIKDSEKVLKEKEHMNEPHRFQENDYHFRDDNWTQKNVSKNNGRTYDYQERYGSLQGNDKVGEMEYREFKEKNSFSNRGGAGFGNDGNRREWKDNEGMEENPKRHNRSQGKSANYHRNSDHSKMNQGDVDESKRRDDYPVRCSKEKEYSDGNSEKFSSPQWRNNYPKGKKEINDEGNEFRKDISKEKEWRDGNSEKFRPPQGRNNSTKVIRDDYYEIRGDRRGCRTNKEWREENSERNRPIQGSNYYAKGNEEDNNIGNEDRKGGPKDNEWRNENSERNRPLQGKNNYSRGNQDQNNIGGEDRKGIEWRNMNSERNRPPQGRNYFKGNHEDSYIGNEDRKDISKDNVSRNVNSETSRPIQGRSYYQKGKQYDNGTDNYNKKGFSKDKEWGNENSEKYLQSQERNNIPKGSQGDNGIENVNYQDLKKDKEVKNEIEDFYNGSQQKNIGFQRNRDINQHGFN